MYWLLISILLLYLAIWLINSKLAFVSYIRKRGYLSLPFTFIGIIVLAIWMRVFVFEIYSIPSGSMEDTLIPGDKILVSKLNYGAILPRSPLDIPWFNILFILSKKDISKTGSLCWPVYRVIGFSSIKHNDVVVFHHPTSKKNNDIFVKRCVSLPSDTLLIKNGTILINNQKLPEPLYSKSKYSVWANKMELNEQLKELGIDFNFNYSKGNKTELILNNFQKDLLIKRNLIDSVVRFNIKYDTAQMVYPYSDILKWSIDDYGPITIPSKSQYILLTNESVATYRNIINSLENKSIYVKNGNYSMNGTEIRSLKFSKNYYFMLGDNRQYSNDSRYFGPVPEDNIIGKAVFVLFNYREGKFLWNRCFKYI